MTEPLFNDGNAKSEDPATKPIPTPQEDADYQAWLAQKEADKPVQKKSTTVDSGRPTAPKEASKSEIRPQIVEEEAEPQSYVWLNNGEVLLADNADLPAHSGLGAELGYWEKDGKVFSIVAVYPKEITIKENA